MTRCVGEAISWPRLEAFALEPRDSEIAAHLAGCDACAACFAALRGDRVVLRPLPDVAAAAGHAGNAARGAVRRSRRRASLAGGLALALAAVLALVAWPPDEQAAPPDLAIARGVARLKGTGDVVLDVVRERAGAIRTDVRSYAAGDRWKLVVTCPPTATGSPLAIDVRVWEDGAAAVDRPLPRATIACGNRIALPGAFSISGTRPHHVCARFGGTAEACLLLVPD